MPDNNSPINRLMISVTVFLCLLCGILFTQSSAGPSGNDRTSVIAGNTSASSDTALNTSTVQVGSATSIPSEAPPSPVPTKAPEEQQVSSEAAQGIWTADGSDWKFLVDGKPYTGWLTDTDGHRYYFNKKGIMQRGWLKLKKKQYYLDEDGILQTGTITIDGKKYTFGSDGVLQK